VYLASSNTDADHEEWLVDSGASFHMTPHREWFWEYEMYDGGNAFLGDDLTSRIIGQGKFKLRLIDGRIRTPTVSGEKVMRWHKRLGHIREKGLRLLHGKGMVEGMSNCSLDFDFCEHCLYGKQNRIRFPSSEMRSEGILHLVYSDVFGPVLVPSLRTFLYYVSFIDEFSRNTWIYFLRKKSKVFERFKEFKALVENQSEKIIKVLRIDNGREFYRNEFEEFCKKCSITRHKTNPYTPQQNGVAERMNMTLMEK
jgi:hypothetical protein